MTQIFQDFWAVSFPFKLFLHLPVGSQVNVAFASNLTGPDPVSQLRANGDTFDVTSAPYLSAPLHRNRFQIITCLRAFRNIS